MAGCLAGVPGRLILALALVMLVSACELQADLRVSLDRNGAGAMAVVLAMDEELATVAAEAGVDPFGPVAAAAEESGVWQVERLPRGARLTTDFDSPAELTERSTTLSRGLAAAELQPLEPFQATVADGMVTLRGGAGLVPTEAVTELGVSQERALEVLAQSVDYEIHVQMPGEIMEISPGAVAGERTVSWEIPAGRRLSLLAVARRPPLIQPWVWWVGGAVVVLLVIGVVWRRRRTTADLHSPDFVYCSDSGLLGEQHLEE